MYNIIITLKAPHYAVLGYSYLPLFSCFQKPFSLFDIAFFWDFWDTKIICGGGVQPRFF